MKKIWFRKALVIWTIMTLPTIIICGLWITGTWFTEWNIVLSDIYVSNWSVKARECTLCCLALCNVLTCGSVIKIIFIDDKESK